jgi:hypothetical protein
LFVLALVGCAESKTEQVYDLDSRAKDCGGVAGPCAMTIDVTGVVTCMNDALASGTLAEARWSDEVSSYDYYIFTEDDHLHVFIGPYADSELDIHSEETCSGIETTNTVECGEYLQLKLDGCRAR